MNAKVSVIVPIYNAAVFLPYTIGSIQRQSYRNLEIILVNDCSTDRSLEVCKRFAAEDSRIVVVDKAQNEGEDYARFSGIEVATGDYLTFLDADDWFADDAVETWLDLIQKNDVDIVYANKKRVFSQKLGISRYSPFDPKITDRVISGKEKDSLYISYLGVNILPVNMCGNLYKKNLFLPTLKKSGLRFGADLALSMQLYSIASSLIITSKPIYNYRWGGVTSRYQPFFLQSSKELFKRKMASISELENQRFERSTVIELVNCLATYVEQLAVYFPKDSMQNIAMIEKEMSDEIYGVFADYKDDSYFKDGRLNTACVNLDHRGAYAIACQKRDTLKSRFRRSIKRMLAFVLKYIRF